MEYNRKHNITPRTIKKDIYDVIETAVAVAEQEGKYKIDDEVDRLTPEDKEEVINELKQRMHEAAANLEFEKAAKYRDRIIELEKSM